MKRFLTIFATLLLTATAFSQAPEKISYQAVVRDNTNELVTEHEVGMRISILQGSATGTVVYREIYNPNPSTNSNGLVSIEIGTGVPLDGTFTGIDWSGGPYFIKTETDPTGGTTYSITGTSQILSVPYALHSNTANVVLDETQNLSDVLTEGNDAGNMQIKNVGLPVDKHDATSKAYVDNTAPVRYEVGDYAQGGVVFWVDETGQHGLVAAKEDQSNGVRWYAGTDGYTQANGKGLFAGAANTSIIIAAQVAIGDDGDTYAARICNELIITEGGETYGGWYLPSKDELYKMRINKFIINETATANGGSEFVSDYYWTSTESTHCYAYTLHFSGSWKLDYYKSNTASLRAIRAF
ncbi:MAG: DUF1566 domain-containing protein [Bacteroidales bacterium]|nr:DUF1566 domain-containing protein [Bacteroidales bacterium]